MKPLLCLFLALTSGLSAVSSTRAATRPRFGGTLKVELKQRVSSLNPHDGQGVAEVESVPRLRALVYDRLVRLDANGRPQPALALSWEHDTQCITWRFKLRSGVKWHDGSLLTPADVLAALEGAISDRPLHAVGDTLEIDAGTPWPDLPVYLATAPEVFIRRKSSNASETLGTGPFRIADWQPGRRVVFQANDDYWDGRPFLDGIEIEMGRASREQLMDLQVETADLVELDPSEARRAQQEGKQIWSSASVELISLRFDPARPKVQDRRLREAIARSIDRSAIQKVLLQNYGEATGSIFPHWLSGYAFLFPTGADLDQARKLRAEVGTPPPLKLGYDPDDTLARQVADRVAVNARDAGITLEVTPLPTGWRGLTDRGVDLVVLRARIEGPTLAEAVPQASAWLQFSTGSKYALDEIQAAERRFLGNFAIVPLVSVPALVGVGSRVRNWSPTRWGEWRLEDVWLETVKP